MYIAASVAVNGASYIAATFVATYVAICVDSEVAAGIWLSVCVLKSYVLVSYTTIYIQFETRASTERPLLRPPS